MIPGYSPKVFYKRVDELQAGWKSLAQVPVAPKHSSQITDSEDLSPVWQVFWRPPCLPGTGERSGEKLLRIREKGVRIFFTLAKGTSSHGLLKYQLDLSVLTESNTWVLQKGIRLVSCQVLGTNSVRLFSFILVNQAVVVQHFKHGKHSYKYLVLCYSYTTSSQLKTQVGML